MPLRENLPQRKSPRLKGYDYSQNGAYFITICVQNRLKLFGEIIEQDIILNDAGKMIHQNLQLIPKNYDSFQRDLFVVMPNHIHLILFKIDDDTKSDISKVIQSFKRITTNYYIQGVKNQYWIPFQKRLWQQSFHDHIIRNEYSLAKLRNYILYNPRLWEKDEFFGK